MYTGVHLFSLPSCGQEQEHLNTGTDMPSPAATVFCDTFVAPLWHLCYTLVTPWWHLCDTLTLPRSVAARSRSTLTQEPTCLLLLQQYFVIACLVNEVSRCSEGKRVKWALLSLNELVNSVLAQRKASCFRRGLLPPCRCLRSPTEKVFRWTWKYAVYAVEGLPRDFTMVRQPATHVELFLGEGHCHIKK